MAKTVTTVNPSNGNPLAEYTLLSQFKQSRVDTAHNAFGQWRKTSFSERAEKLNKLADLIEQNESAGDLNDRGNG